MKSSVGKKIPSDDIFKYFSLGIMVLMLFAANEFNEAIN